MVLQRSDVKFAESARRTTESGIGSPRGLDKPYDSAVPM